jgi:hypothetical protein
VWTWACEWKKAVKRISSRRFFLVIFEVIGYFLFWIHKANEIKMLLIYLIFAMPTITL